MDKNNCCVKEKAEANWQLSQTASLLKIVLDYIIYKN
jgi:hypothetical protein